MIYRGGGGLSFGLGVVVEMVVVFFEFFELGEDNNGGERERNFKAWRELPSLKCSTQALYL